MKPTGKNNRRSRIGHCLRLLMIIIVCLQTTTRAQEMCGTRLGADEARLMSSHRAAMQSYDPAILRGTVRWVPVTWHLFRASNGTGGISIATVNGLMASLNDKFGPANIQFYLCGAPKEVRSDALYSELTKPEAISYGAIHDVPNTMNVYVPWIATLGGGGTNYAYFPGGPERVVFQINNGSGIASGFFLHEVGHFFGLMHTHGDDAADPNASVPELVNGSNCGYAGDFICDTPADPNVFMNAPGCVYSGTATDANGSPYQPMVNNIMSYAPNSCLTTFTAQQLNAMSYVAANLRANLACASSGMACGTVITSFPYNMGFEGNSVGAWSQATDDDFDWTLSNTATPTSNTGPDVAQAGSYYAFIEATGNVPYRSATLMSPCLDMTKMVSPELTFRYHMYGTNVSGLVCEVSADAGISWTKLFTGVGNLGNVWRTGTLDLKQYASSTYFRIRFTATTSAADLGDIGLDNIDLHSKPCAGTTASLTVTPESCLSGTQAAITSAVSGTSSPWTYAWSNNATTPHLTAVPKGPYALTITDVLGCKTTLGAYVEETVNRLVVNSYAYPRLIANNDGAFSVTVQGGTAPYSMAVTNLTTNVTTTTGSVSSFPFTVTGLAAATYGVVATDANGCKISTNVELVLPEGLDECDNLGTVSSLPYSEGFETGFGLWVPNCVFNNGDLNFVRHTGATPQANTGPDAAAGGAWYTYADALNSAGESGCELRGPWVNFTGIARPNLRFKYHQYGSNCVNIAAYARQPFLDAMSGTRTFYTSASGSLGNAWQTVTMDLSAIGNTNQYFLRLIANNDGAGTLSEIAFDDIELFDCSGIALTRTKTQPSCLANDGSAGVSAPAGCTYLWSTGATTPSITGLAAGTYTVTVTHPGGCVLVESFSLTLEPLALGMRVTDESFAGGNDGAIDLSVVGGRSPYTFSWAGGGTTEDRSGLAAGTYAVTVTDAGGCTASTTVTIASAGCSDMVSIFPYLESLELGAAGWNNVAGDDFNWTLPFSGATPTTQTGPSAAFDGTQYAYTEVDGFVGSKTAILQGPCFNLMGLATATFTFQYHMEASGGGGGAQMGSLYTEVSTNNGASWTTLHTLSGHQGTVWKEASISLTPYVNQYVRIRFRALTGTSTKGDRAIDKLQLSGTMAKRVEPASQGSLLLSAVLYPNPTTSSSTLRFDSEVPQPVHVRVLNMMGQVVWQKEMLAEKGLNEIELASSQWAEGTYIVDLGALGGRLVRRLVVTR